MTSQLRRKRPITVRAASIRVRTAVSLLLLGCWLAAAPCRAQVTFAEELPAQAATQVHQAVQTGLPIKLDPVLIPVKSQGGPAARGQRDEPGFVYKNLAVLPGPERLFQLDSEEAVIQRIRQENREHKLEELTFPPKEALSKDPYYGRAWPDMNMKVEPSYVCHDRLYFEDINAERYGWDAGVFQPFLSSLIFTKDLVLLPMHMWSYPCRCGETNAGKCLPGDPVPYMIYPPELTWSGTAAELGTIATLMALFP